MDIGKALTFFTEDERWLEKLAIGTGVTIVSLVLSPVLIGIVGFLIVVGYSVRLLRNVRDGNATPLPEWDQWGDDLIRGFKLAVVGIVWALPLILFAIPISLGRTMISGNGGAGDAFGNLVAACGGCLSFLYSLVILVMAPGFTIAFARDEEISSGLQVTEIWNWTRRNLGQVLIVAVAYAIASFILFVVASIAGLLLCVIGLLVTLPLALFASILFRAHLYGQLAREFPMTDNFTISTFPTTPTNP